MLVPLTCSEFVVHAQAHCGEVSTASIACGVLGVGGNKGAVAVSFSLYRRRIAFVCSHFAAHQVMEFCLHSALPMEPGGF